jgi:hypothetical protein
MSTARPSMAIRRFAYYENKQPNKISPSNSLFASEVYVDGMLRTLQHTQ